MTRNVMRICLMGVLVAAGCGGKSDPVVTTDAGRVKACTDGVKDNDETDVDCGGSCPVCANDKACLVSPDCLSANCLAGKCATPTCFDNVKNGTETDADCGGGGMCPPCTMGDKCLVGTDCDTLNCYQGRCGVDSCMDGRKDNTEADVDCGGACPTKCDDGKSCALASDCVHDVCASFICRDPKTCMDGKQDFDETDVDCGGLVCLMCPIGKACKSDADCQTGTCTAGKCS